MAAPPPTWGTRATASTFSARPTILSAGDAGHPGAVGADPGIGNTIAYNSFDGIAVVESTVGAGDANGNKLWGNSLFLNGQLGIELNSTAGNVTPNDNQDPDNGANHSQ